MAIATKNYELDLAYAQYRSTDSRQLTRIHPTLRLVRRGTSAEIS
ncbi:hypothetical protein [Nostoc commune]|nr:hypothetical protein [Nostoc commune]